MFVKVDKLFDTPNLVIPLYLRGFTDDPKRLSGEVSYRIDGIRIDDTENKFGIRKLAVAGINGIDRNIPVAVWDCRPDKDWVHYYWFEQFGRKYIGLPWNDDIYMTVGNHLISSLEEAVFDFEYPIQLDTFLKSKDMIFLGDIIDFTHVIIFTEFKRVYIELYNSEHSRAKRFSLDEWSDKESEIIMELDLAEFKKPRAEELINSLRKKIGRGRPEKWTGKSWYEANDKAEEIERLEQAKKDKEHMAFEEAFKLRKNKDYDKAIEAWLKIIEEYKNPEAMFYLGSTYEHNLKNYEKALEWYRMAYKSGFEGSKHALNRVKKILYPKEKTNSGDECFITTAVCVNFGKPDNCYELSTFRSFRDNWLINQPDGHSLIDKYYVIAPKIVETINQLPNASAVYQSVWTEYLNPCLDFIEHGKFQDCKLLYVRMVDSLQKSFLK